MTYLIREQSVSVNGAEVKVRTITGSSHFVIPEVKDDLIRAIGTLQDDGETIVISKSQNIALSRFLILLFSTESVGDGIGFDFPSSSSPDEEILAGFHAVEALVPSPEYSRWFAACEAVNLPPGDPETAPEPLAKNSDG